MRSEDLEKAVTDIGDDLIDDAGKVRSKGKKQTAFVKTVAACMAAVIVGAGAFAAVKMFGGAVTKKADMSNDLYTKDESHYGEDDIESSNGSKYRKSSGARGIDCHSEAENTEISVSSYSLCEKAKYIDILWKNHGEESLMLTTYCNIMTKDSDGELTPFPFDGVFIEVLYEIIPGGESILHYDLTSASFEQGKTYRVYLDGFDETDYYVEFQYPSEDEPWVFDAMYEAGIEKDGYTFDATLSLDTKKQRFSLSADPVSSYLAVGYYVNGTEGLVLTTDDGQYTFTFRHDGENLIYIGDEYQGIKDTTLFRSLEGLKG